MKTMKFSCVAAVAALLMGAPLVSAAAPDAKKEDKAAKTQEGKPAKEQGAKAEKAHLCADMILVQNIDRCAEFCGKGGGVQTANRQMPLVVDIKMGIK